MSLADRKTLFHEMCSGPDCRMELLGSQGLIAVTSIHKLQGFDCYAGGPLTRLRYHANTFRIAAGERSLTPNGMMVPSRESSLEFNVLCREFYSIVAGLGIEDFVSCWNVPPNLRVKGDNPKAGGPRDTAHKHSDAWIGENPRCVTVMAFLSGCGPDNCVQFYEPSDAFQESWLEPKTYSDGKSLAEGEYSPLDYVPHDGDLVLADFSTIHCSHRKPGAGPRLGIDTTFGIKGPEQIASETSFVRKWRGQRATWDVVKGLGQTHLFVFPNRADEWVDCEGGRKQAVNCQVRRLV